MSVFISLRVSLRLLFALLVSSQLVITPARAHEVQPTVMDVTITSEAIDIKAEWMIEAAVAGLNLANIADTSDAENDSEYDRLRALPPADMEEEVRNAWAGIASKIEVESGGTNYTLSLKEVFVSEVGNVELARLSELRLRAELAPGDDPVTIGWSADLGPLVVRQAGVEDGYAAYLAPGDVSDPIPRQGRVEQSAWDAFADYIGVGFDHIVPKGLDHILFVLGLFFLSLRLRPLLWQVTAFTLAHTVTLALGALDIIRLPANIVEPLIAASIVFVALENIFLRRMAPWRPFVVFCFGLLHGLGFAAVLQDFGLSADNFIAKLIGFNLGVEIGQLAVIATAWITLAALFGRFEWYHRRIAAPVSFAIAIIATFWVLERTDTISTDGGWGLFTALTEGGFSPLLTCAAGIAIAAALTVASMAAVSDWLREVAGMVTSFVLFLACIASFTGGAWIVTIVVAATWVICIRLQSLGAPEEVPT